MDTALTILTACFWVFLYFIPAINAIGKKHKDWAAIFLLNALLGWTFIGWIIALIWSVKK